MAAPSPFSSSTFYGKPGRRRNVVVPIPIPDCNESEDDMVDTDVEEDISDDEYVYQSGESGDESSDDDTPLAQLVEHPATSTAPEPIKWTNSEWHIPVESNIQEVKLKLVPALCEKLNTESSAYQFFCSIFQEDIVEAVLFQTNMYNQWRSMQEGGRRPVPQISRKELLQAFGIILYMGVVKLPNRRMYWSKATGIEAVYSTMPRNRFDEILSTLHFNDNELAKKPGEPGYSKIYKLLPLVKMLRERFGSIIETETSVAIDESMIPFKGRHSLKKYMPKKPVKWGYKLWCKSGVSGYTYDFEICDSSVGLPAGVNFERPLGEYSAVVVRLTQNLPPNKHKVFFDNLFSCPELLMYLRKQKIYALSTIQENRTRGSAIATEKKLKEQGRGASDERTSKDVVVCAWLDSKRVLTASNFIGKEPVGECKRYDRKEKKEITVKRPAAVECYNRFMGGVDKSDMLLSLYRTKCRSRKWYIRIFTHLLSLCVVNSWCIYREIGGNGSLIDFLVDISRSLMAGVELENDEEERPVAKKPKRSFKACDVPDAVKNDGYFHWPYQMNNQNRCKMPDCTRRSRFMCSKCDIVLCVVGSDCFLKFHNAV